MTSNGGLSRRRVAAGGSSSTSTSDDGPTSPFSNGAPLASPSAHAGSAFEGGSKIAFDPRDLEREGEDKKQGGRAPRLTIMEEVLLLGLKDKQVCVIIVWPGLRPFFIFIPMLCSRELDYWKPFHLLFDHQTTHFDSVFWACACLFA